MTAPTVTPLLLLSDVAPVITAGATSTNQDQLREWILQASERIQTECQRRFDEYIQTRTFDALPISQHGAVDGLELYLDADLRSITTLTNGDSSTVTSSQYTLVPSNSPAKHYIQLLPNAGINWQYTDNPYGAISVNGLWGYGGQWVTTAATVDGVHNGSVTTLAVSDGPQFEVGMTLQVGTEYLYVSAVSSNNLAVSRAVNGSTAGTYSGGEAIAYWQAHQLVRQAVLFLVLWAEERAKARLSGEAFIADTGIPITVSALPGEVTALIKPLKRKFHLMGSVG